MDLLLNISATSLTLVILALFALIFHDRFYNLAKKYNGLSIILAGSLSLVLAVSSALAFEGVGNTISAALFACLIMSVFMVILTGGTQGEIAARYAAPVQVRIIDKWFPEIHHKMFAYLVSVLVPTATVIIALPNTAPELVNLLFSVGGIMLGNLIYSMMFWIKVDSF